jgi:hypothetical protein
MKHLFDYLKEYFIVKNEIRQRLDQLAIQLRYCK